MREAVIVASARTPLAKSHRGSFNMTRPDDLASHAIRSALAQVPALDPSEIEDVIIGCGLPEGPSGSNVARVSLLGAGLPASIAGTTVNRFCSSGLQAIAMAAHRVLVDGADVAIGGGTESITLVQNDKMRVADMVNPKIQKEWPGIYMGMGQTAEIVAERYKISREDQDQYALISQQRTAKAQDMGWLNDIVPITVAKRAQKQKDGTTTFEENVTVSKDECNRPDTTLEGLAKLPPAFKQGGSVTAGNASQLSDGASATIVMSLERAKRLGLEPLGFYRGFAVAGCNPEEMGIGPVFAVPKLLAKAGLKIDDIDIVELNEAFASQLLYCQRQLDVPLEKLNPLGGSISIGHPYGMTGSRMTAQVLNHLRRTKGRYGIVTMCVGGGMGAAGLFEAA
ncbi:MAG TPA: thiolase family protein [Myxococcota bacterium]|jgi:acetyl-CoA acetyltransferase family protein|nr:thiolase family protein [Myxococcota bacterium]